MSTETPLTSRPYYPALDGLRGLAILLVVVYHNFGFIQYSSFGWLGVDLFFVLSGFLITEILTDTVGKKAYLRNFYARRALRIFPLYYLALFIFLLLLPPTGIFPDAGYYVAHQAWLWTYLQNWLFIFKSNDTTVTLHHLWSLAVEEQFYLLWPLVILLLRKPGRLLAAMIFLLLGVIALRYWIWQYEVSDLSYFRLYTFTRIDGLCIGSIIALLRRMQPGFLKRATPFIVLGFALINFGFFFLNRRYDFSFPYLALVGYTTFAMIFGLLVNEAATADTRMLNRLLDSGVLRFFGRISYGLYIIHWPLYVLGRPWLEKWMGDHPLLGTPMVISLVATLPAILLAWLSLRYFESRFLGLKKHFT